MTADLATLTPPEVDTLLADLWQRTAQARHYLAWELSYADRYPNSYRRDDCRIAALRNEIAGLRVEAAPYEAEYAARRWSRFFLVKNTGGHIHSSMDCSTCYDTTRFGWLPALSGLTEKDAVDAEGEILCTVCFPTAPVAWTSGTSRADKEAKAERDAAKAARDAKKLEKALLPDGSTLRVQIETGRTEQFETLHAAKAWLTDAAWWTYEYGTRGIRHPSYPAAAEAQVAAAVAAKAGETVDEVLAAAKTRAAKRQS